MPLFIAQVADQLTALIQPIQCQQMRPAQIVDMDIIANTCPIGCIVVGSVNFDIVAFSHGGLDGQWNQMGFWSMILTYGGVIAGTACVEISKSRISKFSRLALVGAHPFDRRFCSAVGIYRLSWRI